MKLPMAGGNRETRLRLELLGSAWRRAPSEATGRPRNRADALSGERPLFPATQPFDGQTEAVLHAAYRFGQLPYLVAS